MRGQQYFERLLIVVIALAFVYGSYYFLDMDGGGLDENIDAARFEDNVAPMKDDLLGPKPQNPPKAVVEPPPSPPAEPPAPPAPVPEQPSPEKEPEAKSPPEPAQPPPPKEEAKTTSTTETTTTATTSSPAAVASSAEAAPSPASSPAPPPPAPSDGRKPENLVIITSVIKTQPGNLANGATRSRFDHIERFQQTINSIKTVRECNPNPFIVIVEASLDPISDYLKSQLKEAGADLVYDVRNKSQVNNPKKFVAEPSLIVDFLESPDYTKLEKEHNFVTISKLSGRYWLLKDIHNYTRLTEHGKLSASCKGDGSAPDTWLHTSYYILPFRLKDLYVKDMKEGILENFALQEGGDRELERNQFRMFLKAGEVHCFDELKKDYIGLSGHIATIGYTTVNR